MYEADGIDLTKSQYEALRKLEALGGKADSAMLGEARSSMSIKSAYGALEKHGLVHMSHTSDGKLLEIKLKQPAASDWLASYGKARRGRWLRSAADWAKLAVSAVMFPASPSSPAPVEEPSQREAGEVQHEQP